MRASTPLCGLLVAALFLVPACGGGGGGGGGGSSGAPLDVAVTDSPSETIDRFEVDVSSITLHRVDGAVVETLSRTSRIDFADLVSLSELFTRATVPAGVYDRVALTLDFAPASVHLDGQASDATVRDASGNVLTGALTVDVEFPSDRRLVVVAGVPRFLELDFDLDASTTIDTVANRVDVGAVLYARAEPSDPKPLRAYGRLVSTNTTASTFTMEVLRRREIVRGIEREITTDASTKFEVDGTTATGAAGLALLDARPVGTRLEVRGIFDPSTHVFLARAVEAGRGIFDGTRDFVEGLVTARTGAAGANPVLTVLGMGVDRGTSVTFNRAFTVNASFSNTKVVEQGDTSAHDTDDVNVGQRVLAFGDLTGSTLDATSAGRGLVRLVETDVSGGATGPVSAGVLTANVRHIGRRPSGPLFFNFSVGGTTLADPTALAIGTGALSLPTITAGSAIVVRGFFAPVDASPTAPDFTATTVIDRTAAASLLGVRWATPTAAPFAASASTGVTVDISAASFAKVDVGAVLPVDLLGGANPKVVPDVAKGLYAILENGRVTLHRDFAVWLADVQARLARSPGAVSAAELGAIGAWDGATSTLTAHRVQLRLR